MTLQADERNRIRKALGVYVDETPPGPEWRDWDTARATTAPGRSGPSGPLVALAAGVVVLVVVGGVAALLSSTPGSPLGAQNEASVDLAGSSLVEGVDTWADWYEAVLARAVPNGPDATVLQASLGPVPEFDTTDLGEEQRLEPVDQETNDVRWTQLMDEPLLAMTELGTLVIFGEVRSVVAGVAPAVYDFSDPANPNSRPPENVLCWDTVSPSNPPGSSVSGPSCTGRTQTIEYGVGSAGTSGSLGVADSVTLVVSPDTSLVAMESGATKLWQRPRGGLAVFVADLFGEDPQDTKVEWWAYAASGEVIAQSTQSFGTDWGPLAVVSGGAGGDNALIVGTIQISDECVLLNEQGSNVLLVWSSENTIWSTDSNDVQFETASGEFLEMRDGDEVRLGGGGSSVNEGGLSATEFLASIDWTSEPNPSCVTDTRWFVGDVLSVTSGG